MERRVRSFIRATLLAAALAAPAPAVLADGRSGEESARRLAEEAQQAAMEAANKILSALNLMIGAIPMYEAPEVLENGDIIIRRKRDETAPPQKRQDDGDGNSREALSETKT